MKTFALVILAIMVGLTSYGQTTVSLKLDAGGEDATIDDFTPLQNNPNEIEYFSGSWTIGGTAVIWRNLFKFDFSVLPANAIIQSAHLNLYFAPQNNFVATDTSLTNSNQSVLQRVTGPWSENSVNWMNQPGTTTQNEVMFPASVSSTQDYLLTDVTAIVQDVFNSASNDGFMLKLQNETPYARLIFASGDYPDPALLPELIITYTQCSTFELSDNGEDATVDTYNPGNNYPDEIELTANAWTINGIPTVWRSLLKFDLTSIPSNAIITDAHLSLFYADTNNFGNALHSSLTSSNQSLIQRVIDPWSENSVTWNNQPASTPQNQAILSQSVTGFDDYTGLDVAAMVQEMLLSPNGNQGFLLRLTNENYYAQMLFASGDNPHTGNHPSLEVCYTIPTAIQVISSTAQNWSVYPNPSEGEITIMAKDIRSIEICNSSGQLIYKKSALGGITNSLKIDLNHLPAGICFVRILSGENWLTKKVLIN